MYLSQKGSTAALWEGRGGHTLPTWCTLSGSPSDQSLPLWQGPLQAQVHVCM